jgi:hypothetical protein
MTNSPIYNHLKYKTAINYSERWAVEVYCKEELKMHDF